MHHDINIIKSEPKACLTIEFLPGTDIRNAIFEAKELAIKLNLAVVRFEFNGKHLTIGQNADIDQAVDAYGDPQTKRVCC